MTAAMNATAALRRKATRKFGIAAGKASLSSCTIRGAPRLRKTSEEPAGKSSRPELTRTNVGNMDTMAAMARTVVAE